MENIKKRSYYWDNIKGLLMFIVVFGHCLYDIRDHRLISALVDTFITFGMPAFVFVSGYFSKSRHSRSAEVFLRFAAAYFLFNSTFLLQRYIQGMPVSFLTPYRHTWYLLALIVWRLTVGCLPKKPAVLIGSTVLALLIGFVPELENTLAINRIVAYYPFFLAGYFFTEAQAERVRSIPRKYKILLCLALAAAYPVTLWFGGKIFHWSRDALMMRQYVSLPDLPGRLTVFVLAWFVIGLLVLLSPDRKLPLCTQLGKNSLPVYLLHRYAALAFASVWTRYLRGCCPSLCVLPAAAAVSLLIAWLFSRQWASKAVSACLDCGAALISGTKKSPWRFVYYLMAAAVLFCLMKYF